MKKNLSAFAISATLALGAQTSTAIAQDLWIGQIVMGGWNFCPRTTVRADGSLLAISSNSALFSLLGCTYGGDCRTTFAVPDLRGRIAMHNGNGPGLQPVALGQRGGADQVTLNINQMPSHTHTITNTVTSEAKVSAGPATATAGENNALSNGAAGTYTSIAAPTKNLKDGTVSVSVASTASPAGGNQSTNIQNPYLGVMYCVVTQGIFPSRN